MIRYALICAADHDFEAWFRSSADFDTQSAQGLVMCPACGETQVTRALMAPNVQSRRGHQGDVPVDDAGPAVARQPVMVPDPKQKAMLEALTDLRRKLTENADYVGPRFAEEARKMHYGEAEHRGIYGEASGEEAQALAEEGIEVHPLPTLPDDRN